MDTNGVNTKFFGRLLEYLLFRRGADAWLVLLLGLSHGLAHGLKVFHSNQVVYFVSGMRMYNPDFLAGDWFAAETYHYHVVFSYLLYLMQFVGSIEVMTCVGYLVCNVIFVWGLYLLALALCGYWRIGLLGVVVWLALSLAHEMALAQREIFIFNFEPAQVSGAFLTAGVGLLLHRRVMGSALLLGLGGMFHFGLMLAFAPVIAALGLWVMRSGAGWKRMGLWAFGLMICWGGVAVEAWLKLRSDVMPESVIDPVRVLIEVRLPHHFSLEHWALNQSLGWLWLAATGAWGLFLFGRKRRCAGIWWIYVPAMLTVALSVGFVWLGIFDFLTTFTLYRVAGLGFLMGLMASLEGLFRLERFMGRGGKPSLWMQVWMGFTVSGLAYWVMYYPMELKGYHGVLFLCLLTPFAVASFSAKWLTRRGQRLAVLITALAALAVAYLIFGKDYRISPESRGHVQVEAAGPAILAVVMVLAFAAAGIMRYRSRRLLMILLLGILLVKAPMGLARQSTNGRHARIPYTGFMLNWIKQNTKPSDIFIVLPHDSQFRLQAERPVVVDYKGAPWLPGETLEWYHRYCDVYGVRPEDYGRPFFHPFSQNMDTARAQMLRRKYGADYLVVYKNIHRASLRGLKKVFENRMYAIYRIDCPENVE